MRPSDLYSVRIWSIMIRRRRSWAFLCLELYLYLYLTNNAGWMVKRMKTIQRWAPWNCERQFLYFLVFESFWVFESLWVFPKLVGLHFQRITTHWTCSNNAVSEFDQPCWFQVQALPGERGWRGWCRDGNGLSWGEWGGGQYPSWEREPAAKQSDWEVSTLLF